MSLRDQMLKAGLITPEQAKRTAHKQRQDNKREAKQTDHRQREEQEQAAQHKVQGEREAQRKQHQTQARERQQTQAQREAVNQEGQRRGSTVEMAYREGVPAKWEGPRRYHYAAHGRIECLQVNDDIARKLENGQAAIVASERNPQRHLPMLSGPARKLREAAPERILVWHEAPSNPAAGA